MWHLFHFNFCRLLECLINQWKPFSVCKWVPSDRRVLFLFCQNQLTCSCFLLVFPPVSDFHSVPATPSTQQFLSCCALPFLFPSLPYASLRGLSGRRTKRLNMWVWSVLRAAGMWTTYCISPVNFTRVTIVPLKVGVEVFFCILLN